MTVCRGLAETEAFAKRLASRLRPGDVVLLTGDLGAGKTTLTRFLVSFLGGDGRQVSSPTFTLMARYPGPVPLVHVDLYRLAHTHDVFFDELEEAMSPESIVIVEWGERIAASVSSMCSGRVFTVRIRFIDETTREIEMS